MLQRAQVHGSSALSALATGRSGRAMRLNHALEFSVVCKDIGVPLIKVSSEFHIYIGKLILTGTALMMYVPVFLVPSAFAAGAEEPYDVVWSRQVGTPEIDYANGVAAGPLGNAFIVGDIYRGDGDAFIRKYSPTGLLQRKYEARSSSYNGVTVDSSGDVYAVGSTNLGGGQAVLDKFNASLGLVWAQEIAPSGPSVAQAVATDNSGNVYLTGLTAQSEQPFDAFLAKYDSLGEFQWSRVIGTINYDSGEGVAVDSLGNIYVTGKTGGDLGGPNVGSFDAYLVKYDPAGTQLWLRQFGTSEVDSVLSVAVSETDLIYVTGGTTGDLGGPNAGDADGFLASYSSAGGLQWIEQFGTTENDAGYSVAVGDSGGIYLSGYTNGSMDGSTVGGGSDAFISKFNAGGNLQWTKQVNTPSFDEGNAIAITNYANGLSGDAVFLGVSDYDLGGFGEPVLVRLAPLDTDGDGLLDRWEDEGIPYQDSTGAESLFLLPGADSMHKDLYLEVDAMSGLSLSSGAVAFIENAFGSSPLTNPDGTDGVNLHILRDDADLALVTNWQTNGCWPLNFDAVRNLNFGTVAERGDPDSANLLEAKSMAYRYTIVADSASPNNIGGCGQRPGDNAVIFIGNGNYDDLNQAAVLMHELGHNLSLRHGGGDKINGKPNYPSIMNYVLGYKYQWNAAFWELDYSREDAGNFASLDETTLNEIAGIGTAGNNYSNYFMPFGVESTTGSFRDIAWVKLDGSATDFGDTAGTMFQDGLFDIGVAQDLNYVLVPPPGISIPSVPGPSQMLEPYNDWGNVDLILAAAIGPGAPAPEFPDDELTVEARDWIDTNFPVPAIGNTEPTITELADEMIFEDGSTFELLFEIGDEEDEPIDLSVTAESNLQEVIADAGLVLSGTDEERSIVVTPVANANGGPVTVTLTVTDSNGGSTSESLSVTVIALNDQPSFDNEGDIVAPPGSSGTRNVSAWASNFTFGPPNESDQTVDTFIVNVTSDTGNILNGVPTVDPATGDLSYVLSGASAGSANLTVQMRDSGGTTNPGDVDLSQQAVFSIALGSVDSDGDGIPDHLDDTPEEQNPNACSGDHATLQGVFATGTQTSCRAASSITTMADVEVENGAVLAMVAPEIAVSNGFSAVSGSQVFMVSEAP